MEQSIIPGSYSRNLTTTQYKEHSITIKADKEPNKNEYTVRVPASEDKNLLIEFRVS